MRASSYAQALHRALLEHPQDEEKIVERFVVLVREHHHDHLLPRIARHLDRILKKESARSTIEVTSAQPLSEHDVVTLLKQEPFKRALGTHHKRVVRKVDDRLIQGVVVKAGTTRIDASARRSLIDIYQNFIATL